MHRGDEAQQAIGGNSYELRAGPHFWKRWIKGASRSVRATRRGGPLSTDELDVHGAVRMLPTLLDSASLPDGVIELVVDDFEAPTRHLFDIHDGRIALVEPGAAVPWASISGPPGAWTDALGAECNTAGLQLTGEEQLALRVLAALPRRTPPKDS